MYVFIVLSLITEDNQHNESVNILGLYQGCHKRSRARECVSEDIRFVVEDVLNGEISDNVPEEISKDCWVFRHMGVNYHWIIKQEHVGRTGYH